VSESPTSSSAARRGVVVGFDDPRGLGVIEEAPGATYGFHCTAIADGSRRIAVGTPVVFVLKAGHLGRFEAWGVSPLELPADPAAG
jgi:hypothetical protein